MWPLECKNALPLGGHVFQANVTIFELFQDIIETNLLTKFHEHWTINVASRELTTCCAQTNLLTKLSNDQTINVFFRELTRKEAPPPGGNVFQLSETIFKLIQDIIMTNLLTKFHENPTINVASRVKNFPLLGGHGFQPTETIFDPFHEDRTINVDSSKLLKRQMLTTHDGKKVITKAHH
ncbi:hypothetical protein DPMN_180138 [Dreissena polymorpha]|uniref:Uncharacterized protein n=1 Tax=Dreissena polymorpha TaxID=45954 RepID=A0A9D4IP47_DREPO|nr:hypothetical protein DPMN_180138 [Dreissena polymorpha]